MPSPDEMLQSFLEKARASTDELVVGEDISPIPELKIIFDGYQEDEDTGEDIYSSESYAFFIHKDALKKGFVFPKHDNGGWTLIHRPDEEICLSAWYDADENFWTLPDDWNDSIDNKKLTVELFEDILEKLHKKYAA
ncbi:hypothetical protein G6672_02570 [Polynucleobacter paneuropaeus]|nr:hypothetical protein [Polynucleobacter paneuropaeus]